MPAKNKVTASITPATPRPSPAERRAAEIARLASKQEELKNEAAMRRKARELRADTSASPPGGNTPARPRRPPGKGGGR